MRRLSQIKLDPRERKAINAFSRRLKKALGKQLVSVLLFGSKVRGDSHVESDIDVYVLVRRNSINVIDRIATVTADILNRYDILISPVSYDLHEERKNLELGSFFFEAVKKEGIPI
jgi:predicted nucleotidyltransferase